MGSSYDHKRFALSQMQWFETIDDHEWSLNLRDFKLEDESLIGARYANASRALIDTGTSKILMPLTEFKRFQIIIEDKVGTKACDFTNLNSIKCKADRVLNKLPRLDITLLKTANDLASA